MQCLWDLWPIVRVGRFCGSHFGRMKQKRQGESNNFGGNQCGMFWCLAMRGAMVFDYTSTETQDHEVFVHEIFMRIILCPKIGIDQRLWSIDSLAQKTHGHFLGEVA